MGYGINKKGDKMDTFKLLQELYDCIEDIISCKEDNYNSININDCIDKLEIIYNKLKDNNNE